MRLEEVKKQFGVNYYIWARDYFHKDIESGFPVLREIQPCRRIVGFFEHLHSDRRMILANGLLKRMHHEAVAQMNQTMEPDETDAVRRYHEYLTQSYGSASGEGGDTSAQKLDRYEFIKQVHVQAGDLLGEVTERGGHCYRKYVRYFGNVAVETILDTGGRLHQLQYEHRVMTERQLLVREGISLVSWMGLATGSTYWRGIDPDNSESTISQFCTLIGDFMEAFPKLVE